METSVLTVLPSFVFTEWIKAPGATPTVALATTDAQCVPCPLKLCRVQWGVHRLSDLIEALVDAMGVPSPGLPCEIERGDEPVAELPMRVRHSGVANVHVHVFPCLSCGGCGYGPRKNLFTLLARMRSTEAEIGQERFVPIQQKRRIFW